MDGSAVAEGVVAGVDFWGEVEITCVSIEEISISSVSSLSFVFFSTAFFGALSTLRFFTGGDVGAGLSSESGGLEVDAGSSSVSASVALGAEADVVTADFLEIGVAMMSSANRFGFACLPLLLTVSVVADTAAGVDGMVDEPGVLLLSVSDGPELIESLLDVTAFAAFLPGVLTVWLASFAGGSSSSTLAVDFLPTVLGG